MSQSTARDFTRTDLERLGFVGFETVRDLRTMRPAARSVPDDAVGVYIAFRESDAPASFLEVNPAGRWRGDPTLAIDALHARWVAESPIVYGSAERPRPSSRNSLRKRVSAYIRFGAGGNARHRGGYPTWQLSDSAELLLAWCVTEAPLKPRGFEARLLDEHVMRFGALPFANSAKPRVTANG